MEEVQKIATNFHGVLPNLKNKDYHACEALGSSQIKSAAKSLAHFKAGLEKKDSVSSSRQEAFDLGTCGHSVVLEQSTDIFVTTPADAPKRPTIAQIRAKEPSDEAVKSIAYWKKFDSENVGKIMLDPEQKERIVELFESFCAHPIAPKLVSDSKVEKSYFAIDEETGLWVKARPDGDCEHEIGDYLFDYKTTSRSMAKASDFSKQIANLRYDISAAHYIAVREAVTKRKVQDYFFIVQELNAPFALSIFRASKLMLERAEVERRALLNKIAVAKKTNRYPGYDVEIVEIDVPKWAIEQDRGFEDGLAI